MLIPTSPTPPPFFSFSVPFLPLPISFLHFLSFFPTNLLCEFIEHQVLKPFDPSGSLLIQVIMLGTQAYVVPIAWQDSDTVSTCHEPGQICYLANHVYSVIMFILYNLLYPLWLCCNKLPTTICLNLLQFEKK